ncbi:MAG: NusG domain II-containing protein [Clostridia bacterium]|nr:NusG domain II-containing protein [Clostridia bacterium]
MKNTIKKYRIDIIVIASLLLLACLALLVFSLTRKHGAFAVVEIDGNTVHSFPLSVDGVYSLNGGTNVLVIEGGYAYMNYSECPDHTCENTGKIRYVGETIICLPNKLSVTIKGESDGGVDLVS